MKSKRNSPPWLRARIGPSMPAARVGWYTEENWKVVKAHSVDSDRFEATYQEWVEMAEGALRNIRTAGIVAVKAYIKADALLAWCLVHGKENSAASRAEYVSQLDKQDRNSAT